MNAFMRKFKGDVYIDMNEVIGVKKWDYMHGGLILRSGAVIETDSLYEHVIHEFRLSRGIYVGKPEGANDIDPSSWKGYE